MRSRTAAATVLATAIAALAGGAAAASAAPVPADANWTEAYITESDGTNLHADVLRPKGLPSTQRTPVILSIGPYFNPLLPNANLVVDVYDIDTTNDATLISRNASLVAKSGATSLDLYGDDWKIAQGHRIGVLVTGANAEWWAHAPTLQTVTVSGGSISLPFLAHTRPGTIQGDASVKLESYKADAPFAVPAATIAAGTSPGFGIPPQQTPAP